MSCCCCCHLEKVGGVEGVGGPGERVQVSRATVLVKLQSVLGSPTGPDGPMPLAMSALSERKDVFPPSLSLSRSLSHSLALPFLPLNRCQHLKVNNI